MGQGSGGNPAPPAGATPPHQLKQLEPPYLELRDGVGGIFITYLESWALSSEHILSTSLHIDRKGSLGYACHKQIMCKRSTILLTLSF